MKIRILFIAILLVSCASQQNTKDYILTDSKYFKRFYKVSDSLYRSSQPSRKAFIEAEKLGIKTVINLRRNRDDNKKARDLDLKLKKIALKSKDIDERDILRVLRAYKKSEKPVLIHCWHGSDRTGVMTAAYRIIIEDWDKDKAIAEFRRPEFGYHENWYPSLVTLLEKLDVEKMREKLDVEKDDLAEL